MRHELGKVLVITNDAFPHVGGASTHIEHLLLRSREAGVGVDVVSWSSLPRATRLFARLAQKSVRAVTGDTVSAVRVAARCLATAVRARLSRTRYAVVNPQSVLAMCAYKHAREANVRILLTIHTYWTYELDAAGLIPNGKVRSRMLKLEADAYATADWILCVDSRLREHVVAVAPSAAAKTSVWHNAVPPLGELDVFPEELAGIRREHNIGPDDFVILCPRRLVAKNGVLQLVEAFSRMADREQCKLLILGDGPLRPALTRLIRELALTDVILAGNIEHTRMPFYYKVADIVVIPSHHTAGIEEATSYSALESIAFGKPVVATCIGGLREIFADGGALLVPDGDLPALADALCRLRASGSLREALQRDARSAMVRLRPEEWINEYVSVIASLVRGYE